MSASSMTGKRQVCAFDLEAAWNAVRSGPQGFVGLLAGFAAALASGGRLPVEHR